MMTNPDPAVRVQAIREREAKATKGPWRVKYSNSLWGHGSAVDGVACEGVTVACDCDDCGADGRIWSKEIIENDSHVYPPTRQDAEFIAHAREDIPFLLAELTRLAQTCAQQEQVTKEFLQWIESFATGEQMPNGEHAHQLICSGSRQKPAGTPKSGCCCHPRLKKALVEIDQLRALLASARPPETERNQP